MVEQWIVAPQIGVRFPARTHESFFSLLPLRMFLALLLSVSISAAASLQVYRLLHLDKPRFKYCDWGCLCNVIFFLFGINLEFIIILYLCFFLRIRFKDCIFSPPLLLTEMSEAVGC